MRIFFVKTKILDLLVFEIIEKMILFSEISNNSTLRACDTLP